VAMNRSIRLWYAGLAIVLICGVLLALQVGPINISAAQSIDLLFSRLGLTQTSNEFNVESVVLFEMRLPRMFAALLIGCILAQCGAAMQGLFRNPLADPGIIGVASGAALGSTIAIVLMADASQIVVALFAFSGGLLATLFVYALSRSAYGTSVTMLLLAGVAISAFSMALIGMLSYFTDDNALREISLWQMGSLTKLDSDAIFLCLITAGFCAWFFQRNAGALNAILLGESEARSLGINVEALKLKLIIITAIGIGVAVAVAGIIGFVGLVIPHLVRLITGPNHKILFPLSALMGAVILLFSDISAKIIVAPAELPIGIVTTLIGAPFFLFLLVKHRSSLI